MSPETTARVPCRISASIDPRKLFESNWNSSRASWLFGPVEKTVLSINVMPIAPSGPVTTTSFSNNGSPIFTGRRRAERSITTCPVTVFTCAIGSDAAACDKAAAAINKNAIALLVTPEKARVQGNRRNPGSLDPHSCTGVYGYSFCVQQVAKIGAFVVLAGLVPAIHAFARFKTTTWIRGTSPRKTTTTGFRGLARSDLIATDG